MMQGHVIKLSEGGGEIRLLESTESVEFGSDACAVASTFARLTCMCEVSFGISHTPAGQRCATDVKLLPPGAHVRRTVESTLLHTLASL